MEGVALQLLHPEIYYRDCEDCQCYIYNENTGERETFKNQPIPRPKNTPPPCRTYKGCKKGTPENQNTLNEKNRKALRHYQECKATYSFPEDVIVRQNAAIIRKMEDSAKEQKMLNIISALAGA